MEITNTEVYGFESALRGMRNPMNSWHLADSKYRGMVQNFNTGELRSEFLIYPVDMDLCKRLIKAGPEHCKFLRQIQVWADVDMPRYWWSEADTYKFGTKNSCSTMHKLFETDKPITIDQFVIFEADRDIVEIVIDRLNCIREIWADAKIRKDGKMMKECTVRGKRLLLEGFLQLRTWNTNYAEIRNMYHQRKAHRLHEEWVEVFCDWVESLPYAQELIIE